MTDAQGKAGRRRRDLGREGVVRLVIDNDVYNRAGESWWEEDNPLNLLHGSLTPARFAYFRTVLGATVGRDCRGLRALDVGSGGGFLAEEFTHIGFRVLGVDPSPVSVETARRHAAGSALDIEYRIGSGERLPVPDAAFDVVYCCDVLEHVSDLGAVIAESARALKPGACTCSTPSTARSSASSLRSR